MNNLNNNLIEIILKWTDTKIVENDVNFNRALAHLVLEAGDIVEQMLGEIAKSEREYWVKIFDSKPERNKEYPCDNCTQNICRIEIEKWDKIINLLK